MWISLHVCMCFTCLYKCVLRPPCKYLCIHVLCIYATYRFLSPQRWLFTYMIGGINGLTVFTCMHIYTYRFTCMHIYTYRFLHVCMCFRVYPSAAGNLKVYVYIYIYICVCTRVYACMHLCMNAYMYICMCVRINQI